jgi:hypothetical protein
MKQSGDKLDVEIFDDCQCISVGCLDQEKINFIVEKVPELKEILKKADIVLWRDRIEYTEKHKGNFFRAEDYYECIENIPEIIKSPDYIGINPTDSSLQFIKWYKRNILLAVRFNTQGKLSYRTLYPITDSQLQDYIRKNKAWEFNIVDFCE